VLGELIVREHSAIRWTRSRPSSRARAARK
jgi:hypothetical protein